MFELQTSSLETISPITTNQSVSTETEILTNKGSQRPHRLISQIKYLVIEMAKSKVSLEATFHSLLILRQGPLLILIGHYY